MFTRLKVIAVLVFAAQLTAAEPVELHGIWKLASVEADDGAIELPELPLLVEIKKNKLIYGRQAVADITADETTQPKVIDLKFADADMPFEGIYSIEEGVLRICLNVQSGGVKERPDSYTLEGHRSRRLLRLERNQADDVGAGRGFIGVALGRDRERSVLIQSVLDNGPAKNSGVRDGDQLLSVAGVMVADLTATIEAMRRMTPGKEVLLRIRRDDVEQEFNVPVGLFPFRILAGLQ